MWKERHIMTQQPNDSSHSQKTDAAERPSLRSQQLETEKRKPEVRKGQNPNVEFLSLEPGDLGTVPVIVQALDNQWLPRELLPKAVHNGIEHVEKDLRQHVRAEYIRSLINGKQAVINRAFLYNSHAIAQDYTRGNPQREALKTLLEQGILIPFLLGEQAPDTAPVSVVEGKGYEFVNDAFEHWKTLCQEVRTSCIRFSWENEQSNWEQVHQKLSIRSNRFATGIVAGDMDTYLHDLELDPSACEPFRYRLGEMAQFCIQQQMHGKLVTRNDLYKAFVTAGESPAERRYDPNKPFAAEIKQLLDLSYNSNLADAFGGYLLTPADSLPRTAMQEWKQAEGGLDEITSEAIMTQLQRTAFDLAQQILPGAKSMSLFALPDVIEIRGTDEWKRYIQSIERLLANPFTFAERGIEDVYESYAALTKQMTNLLVTRDPTRSLVTTWLPHIEIVINVAGALLSYKLIPGIDQAVCEISGHVAEAAGVAAQVVGKLIIRGTEDKHQADMIASIDFMKGKMKDVRKEWAEIEKIAKKLPGFRSGPEVTDQDIPTINHPYDY